MPTRSSAGYYGFKVIGTLKLLSGLIALAAGIGATRFLAHDPGPKLERAVTHLGLDPQNHIIHAVISKLTGMDPSPPSSHQGRHILLRPLAFDRGNRLAPRTGLGRLSRRDRHQHAGPLRDLRDRQETDSCAVRALPAQHRHHHLFDRHHQERALTPGETACLICCICKLY